MKGYNHKEIEKKWKERWQEQGIFTTPQVKEKAENHYVLTEFPYPSGNLHIGHWYAFAVPDIYARFMRMQGKNVLFPIGFDSFGLPAENAAIKRGLDPREWTDGNIDYMREQLRSMGAMFDWSRELRTSDPDYYGWTQWIFTQMFEKGLAYKAETMVNWCPSCKTVLANEQVIDGKCERCDSEVEKKKQKQWMLKITDYAERLLSDLDDLDWPEQIKDQQRNWIGKSEGSQISFAIKDTDTIIDVFTTRADTLYGVTYVVVAPEHPILSELGDVIKNSDEVEEYMAQAVKRSELERQADQKEKTGVRVEGVLVTHPATGEEIPLFVADYVLGSYGTGAVMAVPAHDQRDFEFAQKFGLPIKQVVAPLVVDKVNIPRDDKEWSPRFVVQAIVKHPTEDKIIQIQWKKQPWKTFVIGGVEEGESFEDAVQREVQEETGYKNFKKIEKIGWQMESHFYAAHKEVNRQAFVQVFSIELADLEKDELADVERELHDVVWVDVDFSTYNPVSEKSHIEACYKKGLCAYTEEGVLINSGEFDGMRTSDAKEAITKKVGGELKTTFKLRDWSVGRQRYWGTPIPVVFDPDGNPHTVPQEHLPWVLPNDVNFTPTGEAPLAKSDALKKRTEEIFGEGWTPEVETMDTFIDSSWYFLRYIDKKNKDSFSSKEVQKEWMPIDVYFGGSEHTTLHLLYARFFQKVLFDLGVVTVDEPFKKRLNRGLIMGPDGQKMSKSKGNVIDPDNMVEKVGADTVRMYLAFIGPYAEVGAYPWDMGGIAGIRRFLERVNNLEEYISDTESKEVEKVLHKTIAKVTGDIQEYKFNTAISACMVFLNTIEKEKVLTKKQRDTFLKLLAPFAPFLTEELWGKEESIHTQEWPLFNADKMIEEEVTVVIQVNGKIRGKVVVPYNSSEEEVREVVKKEESITRWITDGVEVKKYIPNKLLSFATR